MGEVYSIMKSKPDRLRFKWRRDQQRFIEIRYSRFHSHILGITLRIKKRENFDLELRQYDFTVAFEDTLLMTETLPMN